MREKTTVSLTPQDGYAGVTRLHKLLSEGWQIKDGHKFCDSVQVFVERERRETKSEAIERFLTTFENLDTPFDSWYKALDEEFGYKELKTQNLVDLFHYLKSLPDDNDYR